MLDGRTNEVPDAPVRTIGQIVRHNVLTPVNGIIGAMFVVIMLAGFPGDALFVGVVASNSIIGIAQEIKARRTLHRLAVMSAPKARVVRDGRNQLVETSEVVADEVLALQPGDQVVVDGEVLTARGLEIDESLLTGESDAVPKTDGDLVMSGSFVSAGSGWYRATAIGAESYAARLSDEARRFKLAGSELKRGVNVILRWLTVIIPPAALLLLTRLLGAEDRWQEALRGTVAASVAMVPDGLVLLTSLAFITGVVALARRRALAKELASVELLARVDTLCLDKTGTITTGDISFERVEPLGSVSKAEATTVLAALAAADPTPNATLAAIAAAVGAPPEGWTLRRSVPFSSARKWASASFEELGTFHLGAPDILLGSSDADDAARARAAAASAQGTRVLVVTRSSRHQTPDGDLPDDACRVPDDAGCVGGHHQTPDGDLPDDPVPISVMPNSGQPVSEQSDSRESASDLPKNQERISDLPDDHEPDSGLPNDREPVCLVHLADTLRPDAAEIFAYFREQGVDLKVISGDHPATVANVARRAGITPDSPPSNEFLSSTRFTTPATPATPAIPATPATPVTTEMAEKRGIDAGRRSQVSELRSTSAMSNPSVGHPSPIDASELTDDPERLADTLESATVFGRVSPHQKRAMVHALQSRGRTVAMTGDGVNDVLALKDADMGIAMGTGTSAARAVAQLVLLDNRFATLPRVLAEGRRVINNIERVANLFITKATYAVLLTMLVGLVGSPFPFLPRQLTLIGTFSVGVPGFFLALAPNHRLVRPGFLRRVLLFSLPAGAVAATATLALYEIVRRLDGISLDEARTCATMTLLAVSLAIMVLISRPLRPWKVALAVAMAGSYALVMTWPLPRRLFQLDLPPAGAWLWVAAATAVGGVAAWLAVEFTERVAARHRENPTHARAVLNH